MHPGELLAGDSLRFQFNGEAYQHFIQQEFCLFCHVYSAGSYESSRSKEPSLVLPECPKWMLCVTIFLLLEEGTHTRCLSHVPGHSYKTCQNEKWHFVQSRTLPSALLVTTTSRQNNLRMEKTTTVGMF